VTLSDVWYLDGLFLKRPLERACDKCEAGEVRSAQKFTARVSDIQDKKFKMHMGSVL
jgi:hypothetical protein